MQTYTKADVSEAQLEHIVRYNASLIEDGMVFVDHQKPAGGGRLDVLLVDRDKSLVVAELKVVQDDAMLTQGLDYYDHLSSHIETYARLYSAHGIDPTRQVRLILVAPSFSQLLASRCKWLNLHISLFTFTCLKFPSDDEVVPVFTELEKPSAPAVVTGVRLEDIVQYITDSTAQKIFGDVLDEIKGWRPGLVAVDPITFALSLKVKNRVFAYLIPRRKYFIVGTYDEDDEWKEFPIRSQDDLVKVKSMVRAAMERRAI